MYVYMYIPLPPGCTLSPQTLDCRPIASLDHFLPEHLGSAGLVEEVPMGTSKVVKVSGFLSKSEKW